MVIFEKGPKNNGNWELFKWSVGRFIEVVLNRWILFWNRKDYDSLVESEQKLLRAIFGEDLTP